MLSNGRVAGCTGLGGLDCCGCGETGRGITSVASDASNALFDVCGDILDVAQLLDVSRVKERDRDLVLARNLSISPLATVPQVAGSVSALYRVLLLFFMRRGSGALFPASSYIGAGNGSSKKKILMLYRFENVFMIATKI